MPLPCTQGVPGPDQAVDGLPGDCASTRARSRDANDGFREASHSEGGEDNGSTGLKKADFIFLILPLLVCEILWGPMQIQAVPEKNLEMGAGGSRPLSDEREGGVRVSLDAATLSLSGVGYHVLGVQSGSSADKAGIEAFVDYIVAVDGLPATAADEELMERIVVQRMNMVDHSRSESDGLLQSHPRSHRHGNGHGHVLPLLVWCSRSCIVRAVSLPLHRGDSLGLTLSMCSLLRAGERVWHVLDVLANSPAEHAGLHPGSDYIAAIAPNSDGRPSAKALKERDSLFEAVESSIGGTIHLVVFSTVLNCLRMVKLEPRFDWGGPGCMGCDIGYGPMHRIPTPSPRSDDASTATAKQRELVYSPNASIAAAAAAATGGKPLMRLVTKGAAGSLKYAGHAQSHTGHGHSHGEASNDDHGHSHEGAFDRNHEHSHGDQGHGDAPNGEHSHGGVTQGNHEHDDGEASHKDHGHPPQDVSHGGHGHSHGDADHGHSHGDGDYENDHLKSSYAHSHVTTSHSDHRRLHHDTSHTDHGHSHGSVYHESQAHADPSQLASLKLIQDEAIHGRNHGDAHKDGESARLSGADAALPLGEGLSYSHGGDGGHGSLAHQNK
ncbi:GRASP55/65 PDZ-like domain-containing protein [Chytriomyces sp. MP71]|nr:GRASP55/65 PDZ-like domain-containing protein [Chytriomyces sp. MP71]